MPQTSRFQPPRLSFRPLLGDYVLMLVLFVVCAAAAVFLRQHHAPSQVEIRARGKVVAVLPLKFDRQIEVTGALGKSRIEIKNRRVRIAADPSPRQLCVQQSWLEHAHQAALCLPNQISIALQGEQRAYDSIAF